MKKYKFEKISENYIFCHLFKISGIKTWGGIEIGLWSVPSVELGGTTDLREKKNE